jgi:hypothetical protein
MAPTAGANILIIPDTYTLDGTQLPAGAIFVSRGVSQYRVGETSDRCGAFTLLPGDQIANSTRKASLVSGQSENSIHMPIWRDHIWPTFEANEHS